MDRLVRAFSLTPSMLLILMYILKKHHKSTILISHSFLIDFYGHAIMFLCMRRLSANCLLRDIFLLHLPQGLKEKLEYNCQSKCKENTIIQNYGKLK